MREAAQQELARLGFEAFEALTEAETDADIEVASRAALPGAADWRFEFARPDDPAEVKQALQEYETLDAAGRLDRIRRLATQIDEPHLSELRRLVRFEKSQTLSKCAALAVMQQKPVRWPRIAALRSSAHRWQEPRPAAAWLRTYLDIDSKGTEPVAKFAELVKAEEQLLTDAADRTQPEIVIALLWVEADLLGEIGPRRRIGGGHGVHRRARAG